MTARLDDHALLAVLIGPAAAGAVRGLPVAELLNVGPGRLAALGLGRSARRRVLACAELARRFQPAAAPPRPVLGPRDALPHLAELRTSPTEVLAVLPLDARFHVIEGAVRVAEGSVGRLAAEPREVFAAALERRASSLLLAHNHPSGVADPSVEDIEFTNAMRVAGNLLGIPVLDHLVLARRGYFSFAAEGLLVGPGAALGKPA
jgi:DNA repair protein RadC